MFVVERRRGGGTRNGPVVMGKPASLEPRERRVALGVGGALVLGRRGPSQQQRLKRDEQLGSRCEIKVRDAVRQRIFILDGKLAKIRVRQTAATIYPVFCTREQSETES